MTRRAQEDHPSEPAVCPIELFVAEAEEDRERVVLRPWQRVSSLTRAAQNRAVSHLSRDEEKGSELRDSDETCEPSESVRHERRDGTGGTVGRT